MDKSGPKTAAAGKLSCDAGCELAAVFETVEKELLIKAQNPARFEEIVSLLHLTPLLARHPQSLSVGKQRVAIGSALLSGKRLLFFDEPTSGLDLQQWRKSQNCCEQLLKKLIY